MLRTTLMHIGRLFRFRLRTEQLDMRPAGSAKNLDGTDLVSRISKSASLVVTHSIGCRRSVLESSSFLPSFTSPWA